MAIYRALTKLNINYFKIYNEHSCVFLASVVYYRSNRLELVGLFLVKFKLQK